MPPLPTQTDYQTAVQNPGLAFSDAQLRRCAPELSPLGLPKPRSGGFALTFHLSAHAVGDYAVRCFHRDVPELRNKYDAISRVLRADKTGLFEEFEYQAQGIRIAGHLHPIIKMAWVKGATLGNWVGSNAGNAAAIRVFSADFRDAVSKLSSAGLAHGDLQHGNIIVGAGSRVRLIDYDGMFVPGMSQGNGHEIGHVNYQHSMRTERHFGPAMDRFSSLTIHTALELVAAEPRLWDEFDTGDNLLFTRTDFTDPNASKLFARALTVAPVRPLVERLRAVALASIDVVPSLEDFIAGRNIPAAPPISARPANQPARSASTASAPQTAHGGQYPIFSAGDRATLLRRDGNVVEVVGTVTDVGIKHNGAGDQYAFINFGDWRTGAFTVVIWPAVLKKVRSRYGGNLEKLRGKRVSVLGLMARFSRKDGTVTPQIELEDAARLILLAGGGTATGVSSPARPSGGNQAVLANLSGGSSRAPTTPSTPPGRRTNQAVLAGLSGTTGPGSTPAGSTRPILPSPPVRHQPAPVQSTPQPSPPSSDESWPMWGMIAGAVVGTMVAPCIGTAIGGWLGWMAGDQFRSKP